MKLVLGCSDICFKLFHFFVSVASGAAGSVVVSRYLKESGSPLVIKQVRTKVSMTKTRCRRAKIINSLKIKNRFITLVIWQKRIVLHVIMVEIRYIPCM